MAQYYVSKDGQQMGPFSILEIKEKIGQGQLLMTDFAYDDSESDWVLLLSFTPLNAVLNANKPKLPPPPISNEIEVQKSGTPLAGESRLIEEPVQSGVDTFSGPSEEPFDDESTHIEILNTSHGIEISEDDLDVFEKTIVEPLEDFKVASDISESGGSAEEHPDFEKTIVEFPAEALSKLDETSANEDFAAEMEKTVSEFELPPEFNSMTDVPEVPVAVETIESSDTSPGVDDCPPIPDDEVLSPLQVGAKESSSSPEVMKYLNYGDGPENQQNLENVGMGPIHFEKPDMPESLDKSEKQMSPKVSNAFSSIEDVNGVREQLKKIKSSDVSEKEKAKEVTRVLQEQVEPFDSEWYLLRDRNKYGPYTYADILNMLDKNFIFSYDYVWTSRLPSWKKISALEAFSKQNVETNKNLSSPDLEKGLKKRRHKRVNYGQSIFVHNNRQVWRSKSVQISEGGCGVIMTDCIVKEGERVFLHFKPGDGVPPFNATCVVRGVSAYSGEMKSDNALSFYSLQFEKISTSPGALVTFLSNGQKVG